MLREWTRSWATSSRTRSASAASSASLRPGGDRGGGDRGLGPGLGAHGHPNGLAVICLAPLGPNAWLTLGPTAGGFAPWPLTCLATGLVLLVFWLVERGQNDPLLPLPAARPRCVGPAAADVLHDGVDLRGPDVCVPNAGPERDGGLRLRRNDNGPDVPDALGPGRLDHGASSGIAGPEDRLPKHAVDRPGGQPGPDRSNGVRGELSVAPVHPGSADGSVVQRLRSNGPERHVCPLCPSGILPKILPGLNATMLNLGASVGIGVLSVLVAPNPGRNNRTGGFHNGLGRSDGDLGGRILVVLRATR